MFMGEYQHSVDNKGRVIFPAKFREALGDCFVVTKGLDCCLFVYTLNEWAILENKLKQLPLAKADARAFVRFFFSGASECELDKQGRAVLPPPLRDYAKLDKEVVIIGVSNRVEIWGKDEWQQYNQGAATNFVEIAEHLVDLGI